jgi:hypothetical protein
VHFLLREIEINVPVTKIRRQNAKDPLRDVAVAWESIMSIVIQNCSFVNVALVLRTQLTKRKRTRVILKGWNCKVNLNAKAVLKTVNMVKLISIADDQMEDNLKCS